MQTNRWYPKEHTWPSESRPGSVPWKCHIPLQSPSYSCFAGTFSELHLLTITCNKHPKDQGKKENSSKCSLLDYFLWRTLVLTRQVHYSAVHGASDNEDLFRRLPSQIFWNNVFSNCQAWCQTWGFYSKQINQSRNTMDIPPLQSFN